MWWRWGIAVIPVALVASPAAAAPKGQASGHDALVAKHAAANGVPEALVRRVIYIESKGNPRVISKGNYGLMQIRLGTARAMGYDGNAQGLLDADTNMTYAVKYLAGAYRVAGGNQQRAIAYYQRGYYMQAKAKGVSPYSRVTRIAERPQPEPAPAVQQVARRDFEPQRVAVAAPQGGDLAPLPVRTVTTESIRKPAGGAPPRAAAGPAPAVTDERAPMAFAARFDAVPMRVAADATAERKLQAVEAPQPASQPPQQQPQIRAVVFGSAAAAERKLQERAPGVNDSARQPGFQMAAARSEPQPVTTSSVGLKPSSDPVNVPMPQVRPQMPEPVVAEPPARQPAQQVAALSEARAATGTAANRAASAPSAEVANVPMPPARPQIAAPPVVQEQPRQPATQVAARSEPSAAVEPDAERKPQAKPAERVETPGRRTTRQRGQSRGQDRMQDRSLVAGIQSEVSSTQQAETPQRTRRHSRSSRRASTPTDLLAYLKKAITPETTTRRRR